MPAWTEWKGRIRQNDLDDSESKDTWTESMIFEMMLIDERRHLHCRQHMCTFQVANTGFKEDFIFSPFATFPLSLICLTHGDLIAVRAWCRYETLQSRRKIDLGPKKGVRSQLDF